MGRIALVVLSGLITPPPPLLLSSGRVGYLASRAWSSFPREDLVAFPLPDQYRCYEFYTA